MDTLTLIEIIMRWAGAAAAAIMLALIFIGMYRARKHAVGRTVGVTFRRVPAIVYAALSVVYLAVMIVLWRPITPSLPDWARIAALVAGSPAYFGGLGLILWGRLTMGAMHNVSTSLGVELFADQRLVTGGPFAYVRHPMYVGGMLWGIGALLIYQTWATVFYIAHYWIWFLRARREEQALAAEFGEEWAAYARHVPSWCPRLGRDTGRSGAGAW